MKRILLICLLLGLSSLAFGQSVLPNISYSALLNASCSNANSACSNSVFVTGFGSTGTIGSFGSGAALDVPVANYSAATITVSGTYSNVTLNFEFSDPTSGTNYFQEVCARTDINLLEVSEALPANQVRAWQCPVWAATRLRIRNSNAGVTGSANVWVTLTQAAIDPSLVVAASITNIAGASDPCQDVSAIKSSVAVNVTTATTTQLVALSGTTKVYVCGGQLTIAGSATTADTAQLEYGTGASCGTGTTALTGLYGAGIILAAASTSGIPVEIPGGMSSLTTAAGNALCLVSAGTTISIQGHITFVQQ